MDKSHPKGLWQSKIGCIWLLSSLFLTWSSFLKFSPMLVSLEWELFSLKPSPLAIFSERLIGWTLNCSTYDNESNAITRAWNVGAITLSPNPLCFICITRHSSTSMININWTQNIPSGLNSFNLSLFLVNIIVGKRMLLLMHCQRLILHSRSFESKVLGLYFIKAWRMKTSRKWWWIPIPLALSLYKIVSSSRVIYFASLKVLYGTWL